MRLVLFATESMPIEIGGINLFIENGTTEFHPVYSPPNFTVAAFMGLVAGTTFLSLLAFALLDCLPSGLGRSVTLAYQHHHSVPTNSGGNDDSANPNGTLNIHIFKSFSLPTETDIKVLTMRLF